jgi:hypothetical protein
MSPATEIIESRKRRAFGGVNVLDTPLISRALELARTHFTDSVCGLNRTKPETTYDNFARDFGERFVPSYKPQSSVDFLMNAPFED